MPEAVDEGNLHYLISQSHLDRSRTPRKGTRHNKIAHRTLNSWVGGMATLFLLLSKSLFCCDHPFHLALLFPIIRFAIGGSTEAGRYVRPWSHQPQHGPFDRDANGTPHCTMTCCATGPPALANCTKGSTETTSFLMTFYII